MVSGPVAITAIVSILFSMAALWAQMSAPRASPLMILGFSSVLAKAATVFSHSSRPYKERSLVPTMAISRLGLKSSSVGVLLLIYKPVGASSHSLSKAGYSSSVQPTNLIPSRARASNSFASFSAEASPR